MRVYYHDTYTFPLPDGHRFPIEKYALLRMHLLSMGILSDSDLHIAEPARREQLLLAHDAEYIDKMLHGTQTEKEMRRIGFPWSPQMVERSLRSVGSSIAACRSALDEGTSINLAGGTHHAYPDHGEGYCVFNDVAVAARQMQAEGRVERILILDCDVHQGNGSAAIFASDASVFTFDIHGARNFPFHKETSSLDIALPDGAGDAAYLDALQVGLQHSLENAHAGLVIYLAGADPYSGDRLGRLALSKKGLAERDRMVFSCVQQAGLPIAVVMAGGYGKNIQDTVDIHIQTVVTAKIFNERFVTQ